MKISKKQVEHVAHLARLSLTEDELKRMTTQLDNILTYVEKLDELNTTSIETTTHVFSVSNAFRNDLVCESLPRKEVLMNAPQHDDEMFLVPKIIT